MYLRTPSIESIPAVKWNLLSYRLSWEINATLFAGLGATIGSKIASDQNLSPVSGAIIGGLLGAVVGVFPVALAAQAVLGISSTAVTVEVAAASFLIPLAGLDVGALFALAGATYGLLIAGEAIGFLTTIQTIQQQNPDVPIGGNLPLSSLRPVDE